MKSVLTVSNNRNKFLDMTAQSTPEKGKSSLRFLLTISLTIVFFGSSIVAQSSGPQMIDVYLKWGNVDYLDLSNKKVLPVDTKSPNLKSFVIGYKAWNLIGDFVYNPSFYYEINQTVLTGKSQKVYFDKISKYPDLAKRYQAMRPSSVNFVITADLATADGKVKTVNFKVPNNDLNYFESRSAKNLQSPVSPSNGQWKSVFSTMWYADDPEIFTDKDHSDEKELKGLLKNFSSLSSCNSCRGAVKVRLDIKWADDAIDEIGRLYDQYEKEGKKIDDELKAVKEADKLVKPVAVYNKDDEMSAPFEEEAKSAEVFKNGETVGLRAKGKVVFESANYSDAEPFKGLNNLFIFKEKWDYHIYNAKGQRLSVDGHSSFYRISEGERTGTYKLFIVQDENFYNTVDIYWGNPSGDKGYLTQREFDNFVAKDKAKQSGWEVGTKKTLERGTLYTVDNKLQILSRETVYY